MKRKPKNSKSFFGYKTKENRKNEKIGYAISILFPNEKNKLCLMKIGQLVQKFIAGTHTHTHTHIHAHTYTHTHTRTRTHIHAHAHTHVRPRTHTHIRENLFAQKRRIFVLKVLKHVLFQKFFSPLQSFLFEEAKSYSV